MKSTIRILTFAALLSMPLAIASCSDKPLEAPKPPPPTVKEITDKYVDTMVTSPKKAEAAAKATNEKNAAEEKIVKDLDK